MQNINIHTSEITDRIIKANSLDGIKIDKEWALPVWIQLVELHTPKSLTTTLCNQITMGKETILFGVEFILGCDEFMVVLQVCNLVVKGIHLHL